MIRAILFDLDGTLLDTAPDLVGALNHVRKMEGLSEVAIDDYRHLVSRGALGLITSGMPESSEQAFEQRKSLFLDYYEENVYSKTRPFDGVEQLLGTLDRHAIPWGVVTNKAEYLTLPILKSAGFLTRAACVVCGDTLRHSKPHPAPVLLACEIMGVQSDQVVMVGDDFRDLQAGQGAGTQTALATYGYLAPELLERNLQGAYLLHQPADLLDLLKLERYAN